LIHFYKRKRYQLNMMINFSFDKSKREKVVEEALGWFTGSNISIKAPVVDVVLSDGRITLDRSFYILCPFLGDLISPASSDSLIILQEFHSETFHNLQSVLAKGYIENCRNVQDVVDLAKAVNIDMGNIFIEVVGKPINEVISEDVDSNDYDDHRLMIVTDDEDSNGAITNENVGSGTIRLAEFSKLPFQIPNIMNTNDSILSFKCEFCDLAFSKKPTLCAHLTSKHKTIDNEEKKCNTKENDRQYRYNGGEDKEENFMKTNRPSVVKFSGNPIINDVESNKWVLSKRRLLLDSCKNSDHYKAYIYVVPKQQRVEKMPRTPDIYRKYPTKTQWNKAVNTWKKQVRSVVKELYLNKNENNLEKTI